jgi:hypothetical protein
MRKVKTTWPTFAAWQELVSLEEVFDRFMLFARAPNLAAFILKGDLRRNGPLRPIVVSLSADKKHMVTHLNPLNCDDHVQALAGDVMEPPVNGYCFVPRVDVEKHPIAATPTMTAPHQSDEIRPTERRRGPILKHDLFAIAGEIARRCIDPKTRVLRLPKSERRLAKDVLEWCQEKHNKEPAESGMREAVKAICAALRVAYK